MDIKKKAITQYFSYRKHGLHRFIVENEKGEEWKVHISNYNTCSCSPKRSYCIHIFYILFFKYKVHIQHPILNKSIYSDRELDNIFKKRYSSIPKKIFRKESKKKSNFNFFELGKASKQMRMETHSNIPQAVEIKQKETCCVCMCEIKSSQAECKSCSQLFHPECIDNWIVSCLYDQKDATCPLCRSLLVQI